MLWVRGRLCGRQRPVVRQLGGGCCVSVKGHCETGNGLMGLDEGVLCDMWEKTVFQAR